MAYDAGRQRTVLFGGFTGVTTGTVHGDTWEYDGSQWLRRSPAESPPARYGAAARRG